MCLCVYVSIQKNENQRRKTEKKFCVLLFLFERTKMELLSFCREKPNSLCALMHSNSRKNSNGYSVCMKSGWSDSRIRGEKINEFVWFKQKPKWKMFDIKVEIILIEIKGQKSKWKKNLHKIDSVPKFGVLKYSLYCCPPRKLSLLEGVSVGFFSHGNSLGANHSCKQTKGFGKQMKIFVLNNPKIPF